MATLYQALSRSAEPGGPLAGEGGVGYTVGSPSGARRSQSER
jgi:hypothetical protein